jgi:hypothetical protein
VPDAARSEWDLKLAIRPRSARPAITPYHFNWMLCSLGYQDVAKSLPIFRVASGQASVPELGAMS